MLEPTIRLYAEVPIHDDDRVLLGRVIEHLCGVIEHLCGEHGRGVSVTWTEVREHGPERETA